MAFNTQTHPTRDHGVYPLIDGSKADSSPSGHQLTAKPQFEIPEPHRWETELGISDDYLAASAVDGHSSPEGKTENSLSSKLQENLQKHEELTEKQQARDLKIKTRVRMVKMLLRGVNFTCSLIVLSMTATALHIFFATRHLPAQNNLPAWATGTQTWPQYVVLATSCVSLALCLTIFYSYWRRGHRGAEKTAGYNTIFAAGVFIFSMVMWGIAAGILQVSKDRHGNQDIWGWSCAASNWREHLNEKIDYALVCELQSWSLICCVIEVVVETITISIYSVIFYRCYTKRQLCKAMDARDRARSDLYSGELHHHSASGTPAFELLSRSYSSYMKSPHFPLAVHSAHIDSNEGLGPEIQFSEDKVITQPPKPVMFQSPPITYAAKLNGPQVGVTVQAPHQSSNRMEHTLVAWDEQVYETVPIPAAYADSLSPLLPHQTLSSTTGRKPAGIYRSGFCYGESS